MHHEKDLSREAVIQDKHAESEGLRFLYGIGFDPRREALLVQVFKDDKIITRFERFGIHVLSLQDRYLSGSPLDPPIVTSFSTSCVSEISTPGKAIMLIPRKQGAYFWAA